MNRAKCWACLGLGWIRGVYHRERCPNAHCSHVRNGAERIIDALRRVLPGTWTYDCKRPLYPWVRTEDGLGVGVFAKSTPLYDGDDETFESTLYTDKNENLGHRMGKRIVLYPRTAQDRTVPTVKR